MAKRWLLIGLVLAVGLACRKTAPEGSRETQSPTVDVETPSPSAVEAEKPAVGRQERRQIVTGRPVATEPERGSGEPSAAVVPGPVREPARKATPARPVPPPPAVRPSALAGSWYPGDAAKLTASIAGALQSAKGQDLAGYPIALLVPHAGHRFSGSVAAAAYRHLAGRTYARIFLIGPSHRAVFAGISMPAGTTHYETPLGRVPLAVETIERLVESPLFRHHPSAHKEEHCLEIQLPFLQRLLPGVPIVPMLVSRLKPQQVAQAAAVLRSELGPGDLLVISSDFTHYGKRFGYEGPPGRPISAEAAPGELAGLLDKAWAAIGALDVEALFEHKRQTGDTICGLLPIAVALRVLPPGTVATRLASDLSGRQTGGFDESVSYLAAAFTGLWPYERVAGAGDLTTAEKDALLALARGSATRWVEKGERVTPGELGVTLTPRLEEKSGVFVTLKKGERLRGCIGSILPRKPLFQAVLDSAVNAAHFDRRFAKVTVEELPEVTVEVSVLTPPQPVAGPDQIVLGKHGFILERNGQSAVYLPQVAPEQGWTLAEALSHLAVKAGLSPDEWRQAGYHTFEAIVFHEAQR